MLWIFVSSPNKGTSFIQQLIFEAIRSHYAPSSPKTRPSFIQQPIVKSILGHLCSRGGGVCTKET
jgi:hypothetical protein